MPDFTKLLRATESEFQDAVVEAATRCGWLVYHTYTSRRSAAGYPDLTLVRDRLVFAELKAERGALSAEQRVWLDRLARAGVECYVWFPRDWAEIVETLKRRS